MNNLVGVNTWVWVSPPTDAELERLIPFIASLGFGIVEIPIENPGDWSPEPVAELLEEHGLGATTCLVMPPGRELGATDATTRATTQAYLRHCVDVAERIGAAAICGPCYTSVGRTWRLEAEERRNLVAELVDALRPVADYAGAHGVRFALEPLNRFETSVVNTVEQALEIVTGVDSAALGIGYDTFHANIEDLALIQRLVRPVIHRDNYLHCGRDSKVCHRSSHCLGRNALLEGEHRESGRHSRTTAQRPPRSASPRSARGRPLRRSLRHRRTQAPASSRGTSAGVGRSTTCRAVAITKTRRSMSRRAKAGSATRKKRETRGWRGAWRSDRDAYPNPASSVRSRDLKLQACPGYPAPRPLPP